MAFPFGQAGYLAAMRCWQVRSLSCFLPMLISIRAASQAHMNKGDKPQVRCDSVSGSAEAVGRCDDRGTVDYAARFMQPKLVISYEAACLPRCPNLGNGKHDMVEHLVLGIRYCPAKPLASQAPTDLFLEQRERSKVKHGGARGARVLIGSLCSIGKKAWYSPVLGGYRSAG
ncbi:hypothetical protein GGR57DRAFT_370631 [Xylariaceae sp. FL1272]|nr:hypothetical protein GGR57DRAFT_370631 [Xylariaceae sp. FL1272]